MPSTTWTSLEKRLLLAAKERKQITSPPPSQCVQLINKHHTRYYVLYVQKRSPHPFCGVYVSKHFHSPSGGLVSLSGVWQVVGSRLTLKSVKMKTLDEMSIAREIWKSPASEVSTKRRNRFGELEEIVKLCRHNPCRSHVICAIIRRMDLICNELTKWTIGYNIRKEKERL